MDEKKRNKREWIKTAAIIFLSIMLVLTFFSNTIMNYSLPQVATEYVQNDTITAKIRGSGTVSASDPYEVKATDSRIVASVKVKKGDEIKKGDVLFELEEKDSEELKTAKEELEKLELDYTTKILTDAITEGNLGKIESGKLESVSAMQKEITSAKSSWDGAKEKTKKAQETVDSITKQIEALKYVDTTAEQTAVNNATTALRDAETNESNAKAALEKATAEKEAADANQTAQKEAYDKGVANAMALCEEKDKDLEAAKKLRDQVYADPNASEADKKNVDNIVEEAEKARDEAYAQLGKVDQATLKKNLENATKAANDAQNAVTSATNAATEASNAVTNAKNVLAIAEENLKKKSGAAESEQGNALNKQLLDANAVLEQAKTAETTAEEKFKEVQERLLGEITVDSQYQQLEEAREEVKKMEEEAKEGTISAPVSGTISDVTIVAGETMEKEKTLVTILPSGKEKTVSFSVTNEQAKKVNVGAMGELSDAWYYTDVVLKLISIKADKDDPGNKKSLTFSVEGDVQDGASLNISVGDKSSNYDYVVPNNAVKEDKNGKFLLVIKTKSSPLGNRYFATRVDVEVLASDEKNSAVKGDVEAYDYVITTASKPVEPGNQVRLYD